MHAYMQVNDNVKKLLKKLQSSGGAKWQPCNVYKKQKIQPSQPCFAHKNQKKT